MTTPLIRVTIVQYNRQFVTILSINKTTEPYLQIYRLIVWLYILMRTGS